MLTRSKKGAKFKIIKKNGENLTVCGVCVGCVRVLGGGNAGGFLTASSEAAEAVWPQHVPGPRKLSRTGSKMRPCKAPSTMTISTILKKVKKI